MESALLKVNFDLCMALNWGHVSLQCLFDLSTTFYTDDLDILFNWLHDSFEIHGAPLAWLTSYITDYAQTMIFNQTKSQKSHTVTLSCDVPYGSILSSLLFGLYIRDVASIIKRHDLGNHCYADETELHFSCKPEDADKLVGAYIACTDNLNEINQVETEL